MDIERETGKHVYSILQLRIHPANVALKEKIDSAPSNKNFSIDLNYLTSREHWYHSIWKGDIKKSGGIATNIGVHFFEYMWIFGDVKESIVLENGIETASGKLELEKAKVNWVLSIDSNKLPKQAKDKGKKTYRALTIDGNEFEFSEGFTELHTESYKQISAGKGFPLIETRKSIELVSEIRKYNNH